MNPRARQSLINFTVCLLGAVLLVLAAIKGQDNRCDRLRAAHSTHVADYCGGER